MQFVLGGDAPAVHLGSIIICCVFKMDLKKLINNIPGWQCRRRIVTIVSDDWGAIRTPSKSALDKLREHNVRVDTCHYMQFDSLESTDDLEAIFGLLEEVKDHRGCSPVLTANCLSANPDFQRIKESDFSSYFAEPMEETCKSTPGSEKNLRLWGEGISRRVCLPQSHGREHLNIERWIGDLRDGDLIARTAFSLGMFGVSAHTVRPRRASYLSAFDGDSEVHATHHRQIVLEALSGFERLFGFRSRSFIAPNYVWDDHIESAAQDGGVDYIQSGTMQWRPGKNNGKCRRRRRFQGRTNRLGQRYIVRNVHFEPAQQPSSDWVGNALKDMDIAFMCRKPAVISTHRVNYVGGLSQVNRSNGLFALRTLLHRAIKQWPNIEFRSAVELGDIMANKGH